MTTPEVVVQQSRAGRTGLQTQQATEAARLVLSRQILNTKTMIQVRAFVYTGKVGRLIAFESSVCSGGEANPPCHSGYSPPRLRDLRVGFSSAQNSVAREWPRLPHGRHSGEAHRFPQVVRPRYV